MRVEAPWVGACQRGDAERGVGSNLRSAESIANLTPPPAVALARVAVRRPVPATTLSGT